MTQECGWKLIEVVMLAHASIGKKERIGPMSVWNRALIDRTSRKQETCQSLMETIVSLSGLGNQRGNQVQHF
jgi:hypothetical protein